MIALLLAAIATSAPYLSPATRMMYAHAVARAARRAHVDPVLMVAIIENESRWQPGAVGGTKADPSLGLGQVRLLNYRACQRDRSSPACGAVERQLLDPLGNIAAMGSLLKANRRHCGPRVERYLAGYQSGRCTPVAVTRKVLRRWKALRRHQSHRRNHR